MDITKVTAKRSAGTLKVTIRLAKLKKGYVDEVAVLVRSKRTKTADSTLLINTKDSSLSILSTGGNAAALPDTVSLATKPGVKGAFVVRIPLDVLGNPAKVSVAASTVHVSTSGNSKATTTSDTTGKTTTKSKTIKWTDFLE